MARTLTDGSAGNNTILQRAGIEIIVSVIITTCNHETNIYLAILCRLLRPDI
jgi:voltage-gated potassium channel Kch